MQVTYGNLMENMWRNIDKATVMQFWHIKLENLTREEFSRGVKALDRQELPPTLPRFIKLCRPDINFTSAYFEAVRGVQARRNGEKGEWSHPAIFWAASTMTHDLLNLSQSQVEGHWKNELGKQLEKSSWPEIPEVFVSIGCTVSTVSKEEASERLKSYGGVIKSEGSADWIHRALERLAEGWNPPPAVRQTILEGAKTKGIRV